MAAVLDISRALAITGWMGHNELLWLAQHAKSHPVIVEIGSWKGRSARAMGDHTRGIVYCVDHWVGQLKDKKAAPSIEVKKRGGDIIYKEFTDNLGDLIRAGRIEPIRMEAQAAFPVLQQRLTNTVDLVFIDGDHSYDGCKKNIQTYRTLIRPGGILAGHDYNHVPRHVGVRKSVDEIFGTTDVRHVGTIWWVQL